MIQGKQVTLRAAKLEERERIYNMGLRLLDSGEEYLSDANCFMVKRYR